MNEGHEEGARNCAEVLTAKYANHAKKGKIDRMDTMDRMDAKTLQVRTKKDRIVNALLILLFLAIMGGAAYFIIKTMTHWNIKGLG